MIVGVSIEIFSIQVQSKFGPKILIRTSESKELLEKIFVKAKFSRSRLIFRKVCFKLIGRTSK